MNDLNIEIDPNSIAKRAYEFYLNRKDSNGDALSDWLMAQAELKNELRAQLSKDADSKQKKVAVAKKARNGKQPTL